MHRALTLLLLVAVVAPVPAVAAETGAPALAPASAQAPAPAPPPPGTVKFFNRDIVTLRAPYYGVVPAERATASVMRIRNAVARGGPGAVNVVTTPEGLTVTVDGVYVFRILEGDLDAEDGQTFEQAQVVVAKRLEDAIAAAQSSVRGLELVRALGLAAAATLGLGLAIWLLVLARRWLRRRLERSLTRRLGLGALEWGLLVRVVRTVGHFVFLAIALAIAEEWLRLLFGLFPYTRPWSEQLTGWITALVAQVAGSAAAAAPGLAMVAVIAVLAQLVSKVLRILALGIKAGRYRLPGVDVHTVALARRLATGVVWLFALAMAYPYLPGASTEAFKGVSVLVGLMLSLGASSLVAQAAGGLILTFGHVLQPGDWVRVGEVEGAVTVVGMFSTRLRTPTDDEVHVPNSVLLSSITRNFSRPVAAESSILETSVTIGYNAPWRQVHAMLLEAAARTPELEREPPPRVVQTGLSDFYVQYSLWVRLKDQSRRPVVLSALNANVQDVFNEYGVQIMSPHYMHDTESPVVVPKARWFEPPATRQGDS